MSKHTGDCEGARGLVMNRNSTSSVTTTITGRRMTSPKKTRGPTATTRATTTTTTSLSSSSSIVASSTAAAATTIAACSTTSITSRVLSASTTTSFFCLMALVLIFFGGVVQGQSPEAFPGAPPIQYSSLSGPTFLNTTTASVKAVAGTTAMLPCAVKNLHNYTVSWVRGRDIRLLTTSTSTYTTDLRFVAAKLAGGSHWLLKIHYVRSTDEGVYLCQVSTSPPMTLSINLIVQESVARVLPGPEVYVQVGSRLEVVCQVEGCPPPALLTWTRAGHHVGTSALEAYNVTEGNVTMPVTRLKLIQPVASPADTGNYSCTSTCTKSIGVAVHVLRGEELAAMQHHNQSQQVTPSCLLFPCLMVLAVLYWQKNWHGHTQNSIDLPHGQSYSLSGSILRRKESPFSRDLVTT